MQGVSREQARQLAPAAAECIGWRQTGGCDPEGAREPAADKDCEATVPAGASGYCECRDGVREGAVGRRAQARLSKLPYPSHFNVVNLISSHKLDHKLHTKFILD